MAQLQSTGVTGSLVVTGTITAQQFHTEFVSSSILHESGSTSFGNSSDDVHNMTGSFIVNRDPGASQGNVMIIENTGDYGSSQDLIIKNQYDRDIGIKFQTLGGTNYIWQDSNGDDALIFTAAGTTRGTDATLILQQDHNVTIPNGDLTVNGGDISINKAAGAASLTFFRDANLTTNTLIGQLLFEADYQDSPIDYARIDIKSNSSSVRADMDFVVKSTSGNLETALKLQGGASTPKAFFYNEVSASAFIGDGSGLTNVSGTDSTKLPLAGGTMTGDIDMDNNDVLDARSVRFTNQEGSTFGTATGTLMFDENFYGDTEYGSTSIWNGNGGGLAIYNEDGWGRIITDANMQWLNAKFNSSTIETNPTDHSERTWYSVTDSHNIVRVTDGKEVYIEKESGTAGYGFFAFSPEEVGENFDISFRLSGGTPTSSFRHLAIAIGGDGTNTTANYDYLVFRHNVDNTALNQIRIDVAGTTEQSLVNASVPNFFDGTERHVLIQVRNSDYIIEVDGVVEHDFNTSARTSTRGQVGFAIYEGADANTHITVRDFNITQYSNDNTILPTNVGIGLRSPLYPLDVNGNIGIRGGQIHTNSSTDSYKFLSSTAAKAGRFRGIQVSTSYSGTIPDDGILFSTDTNLYRSAANTLKTDDSFNVGGTFSVSTGNSSTTITSWSNTDTDIDGLLPGSAFGSLIKGATNGHIVIGLQENDANDTFSILSGGGNYMSDTTYDTLAFQVKPSGDTVVGGTLTIGGNLTGITDLYVADQIIHTGDTDTYMQFNAANSWRVVAGGTDRLSVGGDVNINNATDIQINGTSRRINFNAGTGTIRTTTANNLYLQSNSSTVLELKSNLVSQFYGKVGIGVGSPTSELHVSGSNDVLLVEGSGSTILDVQGSQGQLFSITDDLTGDLLVASDISGIPIFTVNAADGVTVDGDTVISGSLTVTGSVNFLNSNTFGGSTLFNGSIGNTPSGTGVHVGLSAGNDAQIQLVGGTSPHIDFANADAEDYDVRIILQGNDELGIAGGNLDLNGNHIVGVNDLYVGDQIIHDGDTNTYMQFHAADQWRVVTGGTERLEVNNTITTVQGDIQVLGDLKLNGTDSFIWTPNTTSGYTGFWDQNNARVAAKWQNDLGWGFLGDPASGYAVKIHGATNITGDLVLGGTLTLGANVINDVEDIYLRDRIYHDGDTNTYMQFHAADQFRVVTGGSERLEVNNSAVTTAGRLNVGEHVIATGNVYSGGNEGFVFGSSTSEGEYIDRSGNDIYFVAGGSERMRIDGDGNGVGIGTTAPEQQLTIRAAVNSEYSGANSANGTSISNHLSLIGTATGRNLVEGPTIAFIAPANTDGSNLWAMARIMGAPGDTGNGSARGALHLQVRDGYDPLSDGTSWNWRTGLSIINTGNVGIQSTAPAYDFDVNGSARVTSTLRVGSYIYHDGDTNTYLRFVGGDDLQLVAGGRQMLRMDEGTDPDKLRFVTDDNWTNSSGDWNMSGDVTVGGRFRRLERDREYSSITGTATADGWYLIGTITDNGSTPTTFHVQTYAHSSVMFTISDAYGPSNYAHIQVLDHIYGANGGYANVKGIRVRNDGTVAIQLGWSSGPSVAVKVSAFGPGDLVLPSTLALETSTATVNDTVSLTTATKGMMRSHGTMDAPTFRNTNNTSYSLTPQSAATGYWQVNTPSGYVQIGPANSSWAHYVTDRAGNYFNTKVIVDGGTIGSYNQDLSLVRANSTADRILIRNTSIGFFLDSAEDMRLENDGDLHVESDVIAYSTTISDSRLKDDVITIGGALDKVKKLRGVEYTWNRGGRKDQRDLGLIAQEVEQVIPEIVREKKMPLMDDSETKYKTVDYEKLTAVLIEGMKEQQAQIEDLKARISELENK